MIRRIYRQMKSFKLALKNIWDKTQSKFELAEYINSEIPWEVYQEFEGGDAIRKAEVLIEEWGEGGF